ncbi:MAG: hypothetical protein M3P06_09060 [Acidobacteriota bacterium]|nr:hypothetical protein [Acidobacteriota bacterium]
MTGKVYLIGAVLRREAAAINERGVLQKFHCDFGVRWPQPPLSYVEAATDTTYKSGSCGSRTPSIAIHAFVAGIRTNGPDVESDRGAEKLL